MTTLLPKVAVGSGVTVSISVGVGLVRIRHVYAAIYGIIDGISINISALSQSKKPQPRAVSPTEHRRWGTRIALDTETLSHQIRASLPPFSRQRRLGLAHQPVVVD
ncbi:MAG: hypothetical protein ACJAZO_004439 [Myxococcota bacterium]|jgi:hypothetical protein